MGKKKKDKGKAAEAQPATPVAGAAAPVGGTAAPVAGTAAPVAGTQAAGGETEAAGGGTEAAGGGTEAAGGGTQAAVGGTEAPASPVDPPHHANDSQVTSEEALWGRRQRIKVFLNVASMSLLAFIVLVLVNWLSSRHWVRKDVTFDQSYSLSDRSKKILDDLARKGDDVRIVCLWVVQNPAHGIVIPKVKDLLEEYRAYSRRVEITEYDVASQGPAASAELRKLGLEQMQANDIVVVHGQVKKVVHLDDLYQPEVGAGWQRQETRLKSFDAEQGITAAILSVTAAKKITLYWTTGHKELDAFATGQTGASALKTEILEKRENYQVNVMQLAEAKAIPDDCDLLLMLGVRQKLTPEEIDTLRRYLRKGGCLLVSFFPSARPDEPTGLEDLLLQEYGVTVRDDVIVDPGATASLVIPGMDNGGSTPPAILAKSYGSHPIVQNMHEDNPTFFFLGRSVDIAPTHPPDVIAAPLVYSSRDAWGEVDWRTGESVKGEKDHAGPLPFALAVQRKVGEAKEGEKVSEARVVVFGDATLATNYYIQTLGRLDLLLNSIRWLAQQEHLINIEGRKPFKRTLDGIDQATMRQIQFTLWFLMPFLACMGAVTVWWVRRR